MSINYNPSRRQRQEPFKFSFTSIKVVELQDTSSACNVIPLTKPVPDRVTEKIAPTPLGNVGSIHGTMRTIHNRNSVVTDP